MNTVITIVIIILLIAIGIGFLMVRHHYVKQLNVAIKRAQKSEQLKSVFIDNISRTLRSPLNVIAGYCNMILEEKDENVNLSQMRELVTNISDHTQELTEFVAQLHEMSKFEGITPSFTFIEVNLTELMASYRREAMNYTKPDVSVRGYHPAGRNGAAVLREYRAVLGDKGLAGEDEVCRGLAAARAAGRVYTAQSGGVHL